MIIKFYDNMTAGKSQVFLKNSRGESKQKNTKEKSYVEVGFYGRDIRYIVFL